jgi:hypothetical protein
MDHDMISVPVYVSYVEAQKLIPIFEYYKEKGPWKEVREDARDILRELKDVKDINYGQLKGKQIFFTDKQFEFFNDVKAEVIGRGL